MNEFRFSDSSSAIRFLPIPRKISVFSLCDDYSELNRHPDYQKAKAGSFQSALNLVSDLAWHKLEKNSIRYGTHSIFVAPYARETTGDNAIPQVMSEVFAFLYKAAADTELVQVTKVHHTGADPMQRLILRPEFEGPVQVGANYVLIDDVVNFGTTLAELAHYIQLNGGLVSDIAVLVNAGRNKSLSPDRTTLKILKERFANEIIEIFGINIDALTANEAQYLVGFRTSDEIRNRCLKAKKESNLRLRSKGIAGLFGSKFE
jgi:hypothetical protein